MQSSFRSIDGRIYPLPLFFPDATRGMVRTVSNEDVVKTGTLGILVNTFHLYRLVGYEKTIKAGGIRKLIGWDPPSPSASEGQGGPIISDSGGFQVMSIAKKNSGNSAITDEGVIFEIDGEKHLFTPEESIKYQMAMKTDLMVVLDDFTPPDATHEEAEETVRRTTLWAKRCKSEYEKHMGEGNMGDRKGRPYLIGVVQGGFYEDLRLRSIKELLEIGFDGYGYGGWPVKKDGTFDIETAELIAREINGANRSRVTNHVSTRATVKVAPTGPLLYGLGIGKPDDIVKCYKLGWQIFDCVLPTRDARHGRLYVYTAETIEKIDVMAEKFYEYYVPNKTIHLGEEGPVSTACDCELCTTMTRAELAKMWKVRDERVLRLATIHNLRFYALLVEKLRKQIT